MKNGASRRDFVKAAMAATLAGVTASSEEAVKTPQPSAPATRGSAARIQSAAQEEIGFPRV